MTSLRSMCVAAAALTVLVMGPTQGFAMATDHSAGISVVTPAARPSTATVPLIKLASFTTIPWAGDEESPEEEVTFEYGGLVISYDGY
jgi:hypothetical protein